MSWATRGLGHELGGVDPRDQDALFLLGASASSLPESVPRLDRFTKTLDQGPLPTCVTNAVAQAMRVAELNQLSKSGVVDDAAKAMTPFMSRLFPFYFARSLEGNIRRLDVGTTIRNVFKAINKLGFPPESSWEYDNNNDPDVGRFARLPPLHVTSEAYDQRTSAEKEKSGVIRYAQVFDGGDAYRRVETFKEASVQGRLTVFATQVTQHEAGDPSANDMQPIGVPNMAEPMAGGHCMVAGGYDAQGPWVLNSWSEEYGDGGWCHFSWDRFTWYKTGELWIVERPAMYVGAVT